MSLKGLQKGVARAPQLLRQKLSVGDVTVDSSYQELEQTVKRMEKQLEELVILSKRYPFCVENNLKHQVQFFTEYAAFFTAIDQSDKASTESARTIRAATEYEAVIRGLQQEVKPTLDAFDVRIAGPARHGIEVIRTVRRTMDKRNHKQLDHDRHRVSLKKLQDRPDRSFKEEKTLYKVENEAEHSTQDFHYFNDLLKRELPHLIELEKKFIQPLFAILYFLQLDVENKIHNGMKRVDSSFLDQAGDIEAVFRLKRGDVRERAEALPILHSRRIPLGAESRYKPVMASEDGSAVLAGTSEQPPPYPVDGRPGTMSSVSMPKRPAEKEKEPALDTNTDYGMSGLHVDGPVSMPVGPAATSGTAFGAEKQKNLPATPPRAAAIPARTGETATALYPFDAQQPGDLTFDEGDEIEILSRSDSPDAWWVGKLKGVQGQFPGNYVVLNGNGSKLDASTTVPEKIA